MTRKKAACISVAAMAALTACATTQTMLNRDVERVTEKLLEKYIKENTFAKNQKAQQKRKTTTEVFWYKLSQLFTKPKKWTSITNFLVPSMS